MRSLAFALIAATTTATITAGAAAAPTIPSAAELITGIAPQDDAAVAEEAVEEKSPWTGTVGLGLNASKTDTKTLGFNANAAATRKDDMSVWTNSLKYIYNVDDDSVDDNFLIAQTEYDRLFAPESPWNWFVQSSYQFNQTEAYRQRFKAFGGAGYFVSRTDDLRWNLKGGLGTVWNERGSESGWTARTILGTNVDWTPTEGVKFTGSLSIENDISNYNSYLLVTEVRLDVALAAMANNLSVYVTIRDEYDNTPADGDQYNSIWVTLGLAYGF